MRTIPPGWVQTGPNEYSPPKRIPCGLCGGSGSETWWEGMSRYTETCRACNGIGFAGTANTGRDAGAKTGHLESHAAPAPVVGKLCDSRKPEDKLNKLERDWLAELRMRYAPSFIGVQDVRLLLPGGSWYKPDFSVYSMLDRVTIFWETKGAHRHARRGVDRLRAAAAAHRWARFVLVTRENGQWKEQVIE